MNKKLIISLIIILIVFILVIIGVLVFLPKYELNKAVEYLRNGNYKEAYFYVNNRNNDENILIIKELISYVFVEKVGTGCDKIGEIAKEGTKIALQSTENNVDESLVQLFNMQVESLDEYILLENKISKDMLIDDVKEVYDLYFKSMKYVRENFYDYSNQVNDEKKVDEINEVAYDIFKISQIIISVGDNYNFKPETDDIYKKISEYI